MSEYCTTTKRKFDGIHYGSVGWSGDKLPMCPYCGVSPYDSEKYLGTHKKIERITTNNKG